METSDFRGTASLPEPDEIALRARAARAAVLASAIRALVHAVSAPLQGIAAARRRARRAQETYRQLSRLSDHDLNDIGLLRAEIGSVADALAAEPRAARLTVADLRRRWMDGLGHQSAEVVPLSESPDRLRQPEPRPVEPANTRKEPDRAA